MQIALISAIVLLAADPAPPAVRLFEFGRDNSPGILVNRTAGVPSQSPPDPTKPTLVVAHGLNPLHPWMHVSVAQRYADSLAARSGNAVNVLDWDWNAAAPLGVSLESDQHRAVSQGQKLAQALVGTGLEPASIRLIGQSAGCTVVAAAARHYLALTGRPLGQVILLDPIGSSHKVIFDEQAVGSAANRVDHYWVPGASGFGKPANRSGVVDTQVAAPRRLRGWINPFKSDHMQAVRWHINTVGW